MHHLRCVLLYTINSIHDKIKTMINQLSSFFFRLKNKNKDFTLIARDCIGGILYHQLKMKFLSPTINLFFTPEDFNYFCLNLKEYINGELSESKEENINYPVAFLTPIRGSLVTRPIKVYFMHYKSYKEAVQKWNERKERINWDNIYVVSSFCYSTEVETFKQELVDEWNKITYPKVVLVENRYGFDDEYVINRPKECTEFAWLLYQPSKVMKWKRTFNDFDFIKFLNKTSK